MAIDAVLATKPAITFVPELATRAALSRLANVKELSVTALLNKLIVNHDAAIQQKLAHVDEADLTAYLDGRMTYRDFGLSMYAYQELKDQPPPKKRRAAKLKVVEATAEEPATGSTEQPAEASSEVAA
jgi:hypothetical protein